MARLTINDRNDSEIFDSGDFIIIKYGNKTDVYRLLLHNKRIKLIRFDTGEVYYDFSENAIPSLSTLKIEVVKLYKIEYNTEINVIYIKSKNAEITLTY